MPSSYTTDVDPAPATFDDVVEAFTSHHPRGDVDLLRRAYALAERAHEGQVRKTGHPYITHPLAITWHLAHYGLDSATLAAGLLHDTVEDTDLTLEELAVEFGPEIAALIDGVTKLDRIEYSSVEEAQAATIRKMVVAMAQDVRVLLIKLVDRLHNIRTVSALREEKQRRVARETLDIYAPLAHRLGVQEIKHELEDRCFAILHPGPFAEIEDKLDARGVERSVFIEKMISEMEAVLAEADISAQVTGRPKHHYSIYRKMVEQDRPFEEIHDVIGIRVIVGSTRDCYAALGLIHSHWVPISGRFKDYVAMPKLNLYQSLHTTVVGPDGKPLEVQLRTEEMHRRAESGIAAHWRYKEGEDATRQPWIDVGDLDSEDPSEFLNNLKLDLYQDEVFVLTPAGDVKTMPQGATAVDFAYAVHTEVGHRCVGARINGRLLPLSTRLSSGDIVEIITARRDSGPSRDWLTFVRTSRARSKIKQWFLKERRDQALTDGKEETLAAVTREIPRMNAGERYDLLEEVAAELGYRDVETMFVKVGDGTISAGAVASRAGRIHTPDQPVDQGPPFVSRRRTDRDGSSVIVEGLDDMMVSLARCCEPIPGDPIEGFVTVGRGVSVHRSDCTNIDALREQAERMVDVSWSGDRLTSFSVWIQVEALDRTLLLRDVTAVISDTGGNITASSTITGRDRVAVLRYEVELSDASQLPRMLADVRGVDGVYAVKRIPQPQ
ncbi:MAG TPA: bifunctional (p)ppGpp synthetase/guanosine-3',5'-bis(diphosphate) 3'-pyrophosphohydrolase [Acidimicrobiia bacterium]|nr:bifunctional (p)ppGpp synthetase/guanosine-3',5'-bis(diphosphate) 3'-pyrophosphohydrolase [Acidimicrobiia bacterium]